MGFAAPGAVDTTLIDDVGKVLDATLGPDDRLFDMTNEPALFYFLLDAKPVNRYYHVSMAIREHTQQDLLKQLRRDRPKLAAVGGEFGLSSWDGIPNTVRHYEISEYLLRNYRPILSTHKIIFMLRNDAADPPLEPLSKSLSQTPLLGDVLLDAAPCNWGYAPNFFTDPGGPSAGAPGVSIPFRTAPRGNAEEVTLALPPGLRLDRFSRLEIQTSSGLVDDAFVLSADPGDDARAVQFKTLKSDAQRYRVRVGSCPQWYAFSGATLSLRHSPGQQIVAVRLY